MSNESTEIKPIEAVKEIEEIAQQAHSGVDVSEHFTSNFQAKQQVDIAFPLDLLRCIDAECKQQNIDTWLQPNKALRKLLALRG